MNVALALASGSGGRGCHHKLRATARLVPDMLLLRYVTLRYVYVTLRKPTWEQGCNVSRQIYSKCFVRGFGFFGSALQRSGLKQIYGHTTIIEGQCGSRLFSRLAGLVTNARH